MHNFKYKMSNPMDWHIDMVKQIPITVKDSRMMLKSNFGSGGAVYQELQSGLWIEQMDFKLNERLDVEVLPKPTNDTFFITFWVSEAEVKQKVDDQELQLNLENVSVVLISSTTNTHYHFPGKNKNIKLFMIWMTRDWLLENAFSEKTPELSQLFKSDKPIYFSENMDYKFKNILRELDFYNANKLSLLTKTLYLMSLFFENIQRRNFNNIAKLNIHPSDIKTLMDIKHYIHSHPLEDISLEALSDMANMSLSKFKRLFKQAFGTTPYRYCLKNKMEIAKEALQRKEYTVSQTGFMIGYSNLSQFSKAFKNHFGCLPSEIRV